MLERRSQQSLARWKMPVKTALGHTELACQCFHRYGCHALRCDQIQRADFPIGGTEAGAFEFFDGLKHVAW